MEGNVSLRFIEKYNTISKVAKEDVSLELEARFKNVRGHEFMRLFNKYIIGIEPINYIDEIYELGGKKYRRSILEGYEDEWIMKQEIIYNNSANYNLKFSLATEEEVNIEYDNDIPYYTGKELKLALVRRKTRWEVRLTNFPRVKLSLTKVFKDNNIDYEVEAELDKANSINGKHINELNDLVIHVMKILYDTVEVYTIIEKKNLISKINEIHGKVGNDEISKSILNEARNFKHGDLVWGGIVGNRDHSYRVTDKADGMRCILVVNEVGVWVVTPDYRYNLLKRVDWKGVYSNYMDKLIGIICEGEDIPIENRIEKVTSKCWIQLFDILSLPGWDTSVQRLPSHNDRLIKLGAIGAIGNIIEENSLKYGIKSFLALNTVNDFFNNVSKVLNMERRYKTDGLIFMPNNENYNPRTNRENISYDKRILTNVSDICKWKPEITMDLGINEERILYSVTGENIIPFRGSDLSLYDPSIYVKEFDQAGITVYLDDLPPGSIVEFAYRDGIMVPQRVRYDKTTPNPTFVIQDNWKYIRDPINVETITGHSTNLMRKYHNRIKRKLFDYISIGDGPTLLDIASGKGGDVTKWKSFSKIVAVEPNKDNIIELQKRVRVNKMENRVMIVNAYGQDTEVITRAVNEHLGGKADYCSVMLGLSFFWESEEIFNSLVRTIKGNTRLGMIFLTIDGDVIEETWEPKFSSIKYEDVIRIGNDDFIEYLRGENPPIKVNIGHIVNMQYEYMVRLEDLMRYFEVDFLHRADQENFLNAQEMALCKMYSYGYFAIKDDSIPTMDTIYPLLERLPEEETLQHIVSDTSSELVRISSLWDESFMDSYIKAINVDYQNNPDPLFRRKFIRQLRNEIADRLEKKDLWGRIGHGMLIYELTDMLLNGVKKPDITLYNLTKELKGHNDISETLIYVVTEIIGVSVIILEARTDNLYSYICTYESGKTDNIVIMCQVENNHYDLIGQITEDGIKTLFTASDDIVNELLPEVPDYMPVDQRYYYISAILTNLHRIVEINNNGYKIFKNFINVPKSEPYHKHLIKYFNVTNNGSLAIGKRKIENYSKELHDMGYEI